MDVGRQYLDAGKQAVTPMPEYEAAAQRWTMCRGNLDRAEMEAHNAGLVLTEAKEAEAKAWNELEQKYARPSPPLTQGLNRPR
jgi:hypothetical protein